MIVRKMEKLEEFLVLPFRTVREVIRCIDDNTKGIALVVDQERQLLGTVTDGDIRRAILAGVNLDLPIEALLEQRVAPVRPEGLTAPMGTPRIELIRLMNQYSIRHIPLIDERKRVVDIALYSNLVKDKELPVTVMVMAGGYGTRLRPLTEELPKPMLPVGQKPILELIIKRLRKAGIRHVNISTHYKGEKISEHFGDGSVFDVNLRYIKEDSPLGTAGALSLMKSPKEPILVINGDVLTKVDFRAMFEFHQEHKADMTVAVQRYDVQISYGVVETEGFLVKKVTEKPKHLYLVNAGMYLLEPHVLNLIPKGKQFDMTDLIQKLIDGDRPVVSFPVREYWLDIGNHKDYKQAQHDIKRGKLKI